MLSATLVASQPASTMAKGSTGSSLRLSLGTGNATWYGSAFQGHKTASGERFDMRALTCAHRTVPLGSWLRITNLRNRRSTFVRVTDRGPFRPDAIVDVSYAAARRLGMFGKSKVRVEQVRLTDPELAEELTGRSNQWDPGRTVQSALN